MGHRSQRLGRSRAPTRHWDAAAEQAYGQPLGVTAAEGSIRLDEQILAEFPPDSAD